MCAPLSLSWPLTGPDRDRMEDGRTIDWWSPDLFWSCSLDLPVMFLCLIQHWKKIGQFLTQSATQLLVQVPVISCIDYYCNVLLTGAPIELTGSHWADRAQRLSVAAPQSTRWICPLLLEQLFVLSSCNVWQSRIERHINPNYSMPYSPRVEWHSELCQSRGDSPFLQKALEDAALSRAPAL